MNEKEISEIRRRVRRDRSNMTAIYGCYVNSQNEIVSEFKQSTGIMPENEADKYFGLMKRVLSGSVGKNLLDIRFKTSQVADSAEHKLLMNLREDMRNEEYRMALYQKIIENIHFDDGFLILLGCDRYDVPFKSKDDALQADASDETYTYLLCAICPVKQTPPVLHYDNDSKNFQDGSIINFATTPEIGFLFPAFTDRATNIYEALYYNRNKTENYEEFIANIFNTPIADPMLQQKQAFAEVLASSLDDDCSLCVTQTVHDQICQKMLLHKEAKVPEPLEIQQHEIVSMVESCGVPKNKLEKLTEALESKFGKDGAFCPGNITNTKRIEVTTPDVVIRVAASRSDLIETKVINGSKYILIRADEDVSFDGVPINIKED